MAYTADTVLRIGRQKRKKLGEFTSDYLLQVYKSAHPDKDLIEYIKLYILPAVKQVKDAPKNTFENEIGVRLYGNRTALVCKDSDKIIFVSEKDAKHEIRRIQNLKQTNKKPSRAYERQKCGGWHLTSIPFENWEKTKKIISK